jgi:hypothetical protein
LPWGRGFARDLEQRLLHGKGYGYGAT